MNSTAMPKRSVLNDLVRSATAAKVHFEVWWALASESKPELLPQMNDHSDFFRASYDAHYVAFHVYIAHLFDSTRKTASIAAFLKETEPIKSAAEWRALNDEHQALFGRAKPLLVARNKTVAHVDQYLSEKDVFASSVPITYNEIRDLIYDAAKFVAKLAGYESQPGAIGIARDRRVLDATLRLIRALPLPG